MMAVWKILVLCFAVQITLGWATVDMLAVAVAAHEHGDADDRHDGDGTPCSHHSATSGCGHTHVLVAMPGYAFLNPEIPQLLGDPAINPHTDPQQRITYHVPVVA